MYGRNELAPDAGDKDGKPLWKLVLKQFDDLLVKILIVAALVDFFIAFAGGEGLGAFVEPAVIVLILVANATVGVLTETNADRAIEELKAYEADVATVLREGRWTVTPAVEIVPGDIVEVAVGGKVPADVRVAAILSSGLRIDQSILTGESGSVPKSVEPVAAGKAVYQDKTNILFSGTVVTAGRCQGIVTGTGAATAIGKIRDAMAGLEDAETPLRKKLDELGSLLSKVIAVICILVWVVNLPHFKDPIHGSWFAGALYYFKIAVALAVAAIPEGLPAVVTTCLALGTRQMAKQHAIVRKLPSVETLGCTTVICSDKTGTLTTNQMTVVRVTTLGADAGHLADYEVTGTSFAPEGTVLAEEGPLACPADQPALCQLAMCAALCNDSHLSYSSERGTYQRIGEATEVALRVLAEKIGIPGYAAMPHALARLGREERATYCNNHWAEVWRKSYTLDFSRLSLHGAGAALRPFTTSSSMRQRKCTISCRSMEAGVGIFGTKAGMTSIYKDGNMLPVTVVALEPGNIVTQLKSEGREGYNSVQVGYRVVPDRKITKPERNHLAKAGAPPMKFLREFKVKDTQGLEPGQALNIASMFKEGDFVDVAGTSIGKGFQGEDRVLDRRMMSTLCSGPDGPQLFAKGAPEAVLARCTSALLGARAGAATVPMTEALRVRLLQRVTAYGSGSALRTLALACRPWRDARGEVLAGDEATAGSVAAQIGLLGPGEAEGGPSTGTSLAGLEFDELSGKERERAAASLVVFARVEPNHKTALVDLLKAQASESDGGHVVAMTGDGVNDAPALRRADIGIAMGSGTAVAKHAADMVLADDNFATIVSAVAAGRAIFANTKQFIRYMISSNIGEVVAIFSAALVGIPECLNPVQLLWVNLVTDGLPATAIGFNKPDPLIMQQRPRRASQGIVDSWLFTRYLVVGAYVGIATVSGFVWWFMAYEGGPQLSWAALRDFQHCEGTACDVFRSRNPSTVSMSVLVVVEMFNALNALSENASLLSIPAWSNPWLVAAIGVSMALHLLILYIPVLAALFSVVPLAWAEWKMVLLLSAPVILVDEVLKLISRTWFSEMATSSFGPSGGGSVRTGWRLSLPWLRRATGGAVKYSPILARAGGVDLTRKRSDEFGATRVASMP
ncbi:Calcium-transporting ATPase 3, endoplasmic reticulum-type [Auxenochlorella protothecoides]|uniref:Calcium-transporting ATPase 3, endoplasmic reticulum-type n=2 Tax=Auxenochlorella protothecoides TaxID=3075 RepID=A0A087SE29_AUXPR|nr:Calcium-transporting ATPase 3, endoplasmic reticulum-type [Auxenochlorella protothecoides]KFM23983.1 Calcium-transporting ATPase 3, endoplasmic reticulum-type [Auxenochlorella protothecoides]